MLSLAPSWIVGIVALEASSGVTVRGSTVAEALGVGAVGIDVPPEGAVSELRTVTLNAVLFLMAGRARTDISLGVKPVKISAGGVEPAVRVHRMRADGYAGSSETAGGAAQAIGLSEVGNGQVPDGSEPRSNMAVDAERLEAMTGLASEIVFPGAPGVDRNPVCWVVA